MLLLVAVPCQPLYRSSCHRHLVTLYPICPKALSVKARLNPCDATLWPDANVSFLPYLPCQRERRNRFVDRPSREVARSDSRRDLRETSLRGGGTATEKEHDEDTGYNKE